MYSANSAGFTESSREVWNFDHSYLRAVPDKELPPEIDACMPPAVLAKWLRERPLTHSSNPAYSARAAYRWQLWVPRWELEERLARAGAKEIGEILSLTTAGRGPSGRVKEVLIRGTAGEYRINGDPIRSRLGGLRSNLFVVEPKLGPDGRPEYFIFTGGGWGHGVGMCQSGAAGWPPPAIPAGRSLTITTPAPNSPKGTEIHQYTTKKGAERDQKIQPKGSERHPFPPHPFPPLKQVCSNRNIPWHMVKYMP